MTPAPVQSTQAGSDGRSIAMSVDPNVSNDVCTFCRHAAFGSTAEILDAPTCRLGFTAYFRSLSNMGPIWVSDCKSGELHPTLLARDTAHSSTPYRTAED